MSRVLILSGTCGSGKSTIAQLLASEHGWVRISEDDVWRSRFHRNRGAIGSAEHSRKRREIRTEVVRQVRSAAQVANAVVDAIVHEAGTDSIHEYEELFLAANLDWELRVLHPRLEVAIQRDAARPGWKAGAAGVEELWCRFSGEILAPDAFVDTSDDEPRQSAQKVLASLKSDARPWEGRS
jgi:shikimate kinase